jgi:hypothetical protein
LRTVGLPHRDWETRAGTVELRITKLLTEKSLTALIREACIQGTPPLNRYVYFHLSVAG